MSNDDTSTPGICSGDSAQMAGQWAESLGTVALNVFGLGGFLNKMVPSPLDKLKTQISNINGEIQDLSNKMTLDYAVLQNSINKDMFSSMQALQAEINAEIAEGEELLSEKITMNSVYIATVYVLVIILIIYLLFAPNPKNS
jgi:predicted PurR-regulated permease PerM